MEVVRGYPVVKSEALEITMKKLIAKLTMDLECGFIARTSNAKYENQCASALESLLSASQK